MLKDRDTVRVSQARALLGRRRLVGSSSLYDARAGCRVQREGRGDVVVGPGAGAESELREAELNAACRCGREASSGSMPRTFNDLYSSWQG